MGLAAIPGPQIKNPKSASRYRVQRSVKMEPYHGVIFPSQHFVRFPTVGQYDTMMVPTYQDTKV